VSCASLGERWEAEEGRRGTSYAVVRRDGSERNEGAPTLRNMEKSSRDIVTEASISTDLDSRRDSMAVVSERDYKRRRGMKQTTTGVTCARREVTFQETRRYRCSHSPSQSFNYGGAQRQKGDEGEREDDETHL
jgi:hypothetical protein